MKAGATARRAALEILRQVRKGQPFNTIHGDLQGLPVADRHLAHEIAAGVLRHRSELDRRIGPLIRGKWQNVEPDLRDLLRIGTYQMEFLDRVPDYAAVTVTVEVARDTRGRKAAGLVNAVLRRVAAIRDAPVEPPEVLDHVRKLAADQSHPAWLVKRWLQRFGRSRTAKLMEHNNRPPPVTIQALHWSTDRLREELTAANVTFAESEAGPGLVVRGTPVQQLPGYEEGGFIVQDPSQARLLEFAQVPPNSLVWDACASPGGKAARLSMQGLVIASEARRSRLQRLRDTLARTSPDSLILLADARHPPLKSSKIDVTLVDAPCSATGTIARHPDARWRLSERHIGLMGKRQTEILDGASESVGPGKLLIYITCSLENEENEDQVDRFLQRHVDFTRACADLLLFPPDIGADGGYAARLRRSQ